MEAFSHTTFIAAAYGIAFAVLAGLAAATWLRARAVDDRLSEVEAARPSRRAQRRERRNEA
ncbi:MAG: heme exporter protein CcmD [Pseudomonadota bacterium]